MGDDKTTKISEQPVKDTEPARGLRTSRKSPISPEAKCHLWMILTGK